MRKAFFGLTVLFAGILFASQSSSGDLSILIQNPFPQTAQQLTRLEVPVPADFSLEEKAPDSKETPSDSYVTQLSALRYVMRSA